MPSISNSINYGLHLKFPQGAPYGFQTGCLPLLLRQAGTSFTSLGAMKLLFLPWVRVSVTSQYFT